MARNQFGGFGGPNMQQLMRQAQKMQEQMQKAQEELDAKVYEASAGGGMDYTLYGSSATDSLNATVLLTADGPDLQFSYVNLSGGGVTVATTLTLTFSYSA